MTDQKNSNKVVRELKWLDAKKHDPSIINIWELRGSMSLRNYMLSPQDHYPQAQYVYKVQYKL